MSDLDLLAYLPFLIVIVMFLVFFYSISRRERQREATTRQTSAQFISGQAAILSEQKELRDLTRRQTVALERIADALEKRA